MEVKTRYDNDDDIMWEECTERELKKQLACIHFIACRFQSVLPSKALTSEWWKIERVVVSMAIQRPVLSILSSLNQQPSPDS